MFGREDSYEKKLRAFQDKFSCSQCGDVSSGPESSQEGQGRFNDLAGGTRGEYWGGYKTVYKWNKPSDLKWCGACKQYFCYSCWGHDDYAYHGRCLGCEQEWKASRQ